MAKQPPQVIRPGYYTPGQLAEHWRRSVSFVENLVAQGYLTPDARGYFGNDKLAAFYRDHGALLDAQ